MPLHLNKPIESVVYQQALKKAKACVDEANVHMALEDQALTKKQLDAEIERLAREMVNNLDSDLWNDHE